MPPFNLSTRYVTNRLTFKSARRPCFNTQPSSTPTDMNFCVHHEEFYDYTLRQQQASIYHVQVFSLITVPWRAIGGVSLQGGVSKCPQRCPSIVERPAGATASPGG